MSYSTVIFDLDGTLIDSVPLIIASHRHALSTVLGRELPEDALRDGIGRPLIEQMSVFDEERAQELFDVYREFKPGPEPIEHALMLLGRPRQGAVYVGDAASDLRAARAAGVAAVGVTWGAFGLPRFSSRDL